MPIMIGFVGVAALVTIILTQWPLQVDPNAGNLPATVQRLLRQAIGALFITVGLMAGAGGLPEEIFFDILVLAGIGSVLWILVSPLFGSLLAFLVLLVATVPLDITFVPFSVELAEESLASGVIALVPLAIYLVVNLAFDRRRPRRWNPIGAGALIAAPALASLGVLGIAPLSMGLLEAQVPAAIFSVLIHLSLWLRGDFPGGTGVIVQVVGALVAVLLPQRLMDTALLESIPDKVRRLIFAVLTMLGVFPIYYLLGGVTLSGSLSFPVVYGLNVLVAALLVLAMGDAAAEWVRAADIDADREREDEDEIDPDTAVVKIG
jgi:hypothetical protein